MLSVDSVVVTAICMVRPQNSQLRARHLWSFHRDKILPGVRRLIVVESDDFGLDTQCDRIHDGRKVALQSCVVWGLGAVQHTTNPLVSGAKDGTIWAALHPKKISLDERK